MHDEEIEHPAYGVVQINRISGFTGQLFGSMLEDHGTAFRLRIARAKLTGDLDAGERERIYPNRESIVEVELSPAQLIAIFTEMNRGSGVPCTIRRVDGKRVEPLPSRRSDLAKIVAEVRESGGRFATTVTRALIKAEEEADALSSPGRKLTKAAASRVFSKVKDARRELTANLPYILTRYREGLERMREEAFAEFDSSLAGMIQDVGLAHLKGKQVRIEEVAVDHQIEACSGSGWFEADPDELA